MAVNKPPQGLGIAGVRAGLTVIGVGRHKKLRTLPAESMLEFQGKSQRKPPILPPWMIITGMRMDGASLAGLTSFSRLPVKQVHPKDDQRAEGDSEKRLNQR